MHAAPFLPFIKPILDALKASLAATRKRLGKRKYERLLSAAIQELLHQDPDITRAEAHLAAVRATGVEPDVSLLRAEQMLKSVRRSRRRGATRKLAAKRKPQRKKKPRRRSAMRGRRHRGKRKT